MWSLYVCLSLPAVLGVIALVFSFSKQTHKDQKNKVAAKQKVKLQPVAKQEKKTKEPDSNMVISCPKCNKVFTRPLVMLDFAGGKTKLVNVCPYCNHLLTDTSIENGSNNHFHVPNLDERLTRK
jgi:uncharacterized Zn-finger protein